MPKIPVDAEEILVMPYVLLVGKVKITLAIRKVIHCIKDVCFSGTVITDKTIDLVRKMHLGPGIVFEISKRDPLQVHLKKIYAKNTPKTAHHSVHVLI